MTRIRTQSSSNSVLDDCVIVARDILEIHQHYMMAVRSCESDPCIATKYAHWLNTALHRAILHTPFVPFNILFTRTIQLLDITDLARLDRFAASFKPEVASLGLTTYPYRLYELLCQAARLYAPSIPVDPALNNPDTLVEFDFGRFEIEMNAETYATLEAGGPQTIGLSGWY
ncbi:hypothetical protein B7494_g2840 [Chlorociboria aeruginascens]|nr:hypothetical protein B7494_g2840 [Chlorociboria aeruginascens]